MIKNNNKRIKKSFYFEEYQQFSQNNVDDKYSVSHDRVYLLFFISSERVLQHEYNVILKKNYIHDIIVYVY